MVGCGGSTFSSATSCEGAPDAGCAGPTLGDAGTLPGDAPNLADASIPPALIGLTTSIGPLSPAFAPATTMYTAQAGVLLGAPFTVTATAGAPLTTTITVNGAFVQSGTPSRPIALSATAPTPVDISVVPIGVAAIHFTILVTTPQSAGSYVKASNTLGDSEFGACFALSNDTLAVGAYGESSAATGIHGDQSDTSAPSAGAVYVFVRVAGVWSQQAYIKASNTRANAQFGAGLALSGDTLAVGAPGESSDATGINGNQTDSSAAGAGAAYVFTRSGTGTGAIWSQQAYVKASNARAETRFGASIALAGDTIAVGAQDESSAVTGVNGNQTDSSASEAGAVYVFTRSGTTWSQQAYVKASNTRARSNFGWSVALSGDTLAVGALRESSAATGINGHQSDTSASEAGAAYVFTRSGTTWSQQAYVKASNTRARAYFGASVALSGDTLAVGAYAESSAATGVNGNQSDTSAPGAGAVYVFTRAGSAWVQAAYVKASNTRIPSGFGASVAISGNTLAVGATNESSAATGVNGTQSDTSTPGAGSVYVFTWTGTRWAQQAYVKALNTRAGAQLGSWIALSGDTLAVGAPYDSSASSGINGNPGDTSAPNAGAVYVYQ